MPIRISGGDREDDFQILLDRQSALDIGAFVVDGIDLSPGTAIHPMATRVSTMRCRDFLHLRSRPRSPPRACRRGSDGRTFPLHGSLCGTPVGQNPDVAAG